MITWRLNVAGLERKVLVKGDPTARIAFIMHHGHGMTAETIISNFPVDPDVVVFAPQGLVATDGATSFISPRSLSKYPGKKGTEDYDLDAAIQVEAVRRSYTNIDEWGGGGFSGGMGYLREEMVDRPDLYSFWGGGWNTMHEDEVGPDGAFIGLVNREPFQLWLGNNDDKTARVPPKLDYEPTIAAYAKRFGAVERRRRQLTICGLSVEQRLYTHPNLQVYLTSGGHSVTGCTGDGFGVRLFRFADARLGP